jgi:tRNA 5-methylaminomethyl-2-thiouridine biosynthesis bifunctional protein
MFVGITPASLHRSAEGVLYSPTFDDIYHDCAHGNPHAPSGDPAHNVFLRGNNLPSRWAKRGQFVILENGFGF